MKELWKKLADNKEITSRNMANYCILRAMKSDAPKEVALHYLRQAFTSITCPAKLANNGNRPYIALTNAIRPLNNYSTLLGTQNWLSVEETAQFNEIVSSLTEEKIEKRYSFLFTRDDLFPEYQLVQTAHVAMELGQTLTKEELKDLHFACCHVNGIEGLEEVERILQKRGLRYKVFREPDIGNEKTAIAVAPIRQQEKYIFRDYRRLRFERN